MDTHEDREWVPAQQSSGSGLHPVVLGCLEEVPSSRSGAPSHLLACAWFRDCPGVCVSACDVAHAHVTGAPRTGGRQCRAPACQGLACLRQLLFVSCTTFLWVQGSSRTPRGDGAWGTPPVRGSRCRAEGLGCKPGWSSPALRIDDLRDQLDCSGSSCQLCTGFTRSSRGWRGWDENPGGLAAGLLS